MTSIVALALGCVFEPVEIARFTTDEEESESSWADDSAGLVSYDWTEMQLRDGKAQLVELGSIDTEVVMSSEGTHRVVLELLPVQPSTLPASFTASLQPMGPSDAGFEPFGAGLRYEGEFEEELRLLLHADEQSEISVYGRIIPP